MRIGIADNCGLKFSADIKEHWEKKGHEVRYERGASEFIAQWADLYYIDWCDNNINYLMNIYHGNNPEHPNGTQYKKPKFVVRAIDWEVWLGHARSQELVDFVDQWICIAPHIEKKLRAEALYTGRQKLVLIRPGLSLDKYTLKKNATDGFQLGMVLGDMWWYKNHMGGLDVFSTLAKSDSRYTLHIRGQHEPGDYNRVMFDHYLDSRGIANRVRVYDYVADMNAWYENIDVLLHPGMKETFCYAVAEAMAKGIPVVCNEFYGSRAIWPPHILYKTHDEAVTMIRNARENSPVYSGTVGREYIENHYDVKRMLAEYDALLQT